mmetsp:Transcript_60544/g.179451  ORF Transcript_60544/g.179451 Transcript_60544/m.179451 type:complete len:314 (-) Transcript_60544:364-1305(-)
MRVPSGRSAADEDGIARHTLGLGELHRGGGALTSGPLGTLRFDNVELLLVPPRVAGLRRRRRRRRGLDGRRSSRRLALPGRTRGGGWCDRGRGGGGVRPRTAIVALVGTRVSSVALSVVVGGGDSGLPPEQYLLPFHLLVCQDDPQLGPAGAMRLALDDASNLVRPFLVHVDPKIVEERLGRPSSGSIDGTAQLLLEVEGGGDGILARVEGLLLVVLGEGALLVDDAVVLVAVVADGVGEAQGAVDARPEGVEEGARYAPALGLRRVVPVVVAPRPLLLLLLLLLPFAAAVVGGALRDTIQAKHRRRRATNLG